MVKKDTKGSSKLALAALAAAGAAAGYYFYASDDATKNRKIVTKWASLMKKQVVEESKKLSAIDRGAIARIVDEAAATVAATRPIDKAALRKAQSELKKHWKKLSAEVAKATGATRDTVAKAVKKQISKPAAKAAKKTSRPTK